MAGRKRTKPAHLSMKTSLDFLTSFDFVALTDLERLSEVAGLEYRTGTQLSEIQAHINTAFLASFMSGTMYAEDLPPAEMRQWCTNTVDKAGQLMLQLGYPSGSLPFIKSIFSGPGDFSSQQSLSSSDILLRSVCNVTTPPDKWRSMIREKDAYAASDLPVMITQLDVPSSLHARSSFDLAFSLTLEAPSDACHVAAQIATRNLLDLAPYAIAMLIALAEWEIAQPSSVKKTKSNYEREFHRELCLRLVRTYFLSFGERPRTADKYRGPNGPAVLWFNHLLSLANQRLNAPESPLRSNYAATVAARHPGIKALLVAERWTNANKARRLNAAWREAESRRVRSPA